MARGGLPPPTLDALLHLLRAELTELALEPEPRLLALAARAARIAAL